MLLVEEFIEDIVEVRLINNLPLVKGRSEVIELTPVVVVGFALVEVVVVVVLAKSLLMIEFLPPTGPAGNCSSFEILAPKAAASAARIPLKL